MESVNRHGDRISRSGHPAPSGQTARQARLLTLAATAVLGAGLAEAQSVVVGYQFTSETLNPTTLASNLTASSFGYVNTNPGDPPYNDPPFIVQGGILPDDPPYYIAQADWFTNQDGTNINYYDFSVNIAPGYALTLSSFSFEANSRQQVPFLTQIEYSTNAAFTNPVDFDNNQINISTAEDWNTYSASDNPILLGTGTYYFRIYNELDPSGDGSISDLLNMSDIDLNGAVQPAGTPVGLNWDPGISGGANLGGSGTWLGGNTWAVGAVDYPWNNSLNAYANFGGSAGMVVLGGNVTASAGLAFQTSGYNITAAAGQTLTVGGTLSTAGSDTISAPLTSSGPGTLAIQAGNVLTIAGTATFAPGTSIQVTSGTLEVTTGGSVVADGAAQEVGTDSTNNPTLTIDGAGSFATDSTLNVGDFGGTGTLNVVGTATLAAGTLNIGNTYSYGTLNVSGMASVTAGTINVNNGTGMGVVNQSGGIVATGNLLVANATYSIGQYNLSGGTLAAGSVAGGGGTSSFTFNGGTLLTTAPGANLFSGIQTLAIQSGGATINTDGNNVTLAQAFTSTTGTFTKSGSGTLLLNAANGISSGTGVDVTGGTLEVSGATLYSANINIGSGATLAYNYSNRVLLPTTTYTGTGTLQFTGGNPTFGPGYINVDFSPGALIDVVSGELTGSSSYGGFWTQNEASMNVAAGATFDAVESGPTGTMQIDALTGAGTFQGGYSGNGNGGLSTVTIGVAGGSGTFSGNFLNDIFARLGIVKTGSGTETFAGTNSYAGGTTVNGGDLVIGSSTALPDSTVSVMSTGTLQLAAGIGTVTIQSLSTSGQGTLDVENNPLMVNYGSGADPIGSIRSYLTTGYTGDKWTGTGIASSTVAGLDASQGKIAYSIGYADGADGLISGLSSGEIEIVPTIAGDAKLQGDVNFGDFQVLAQYFGKSGGWDEGNFTYGSTVDFGDFQVLAQDFGANSSGLTASEIASLSSFAAQFGGELLANSDGVGFQVVSVPEPASIGVCAIAGFVLLARRRRIRRQ